MGEHYYACDECEGTGEYEDAECPSCYSGLIEGDDDDCETNRCDTCQNPDVHSDPTIVFR